MSVEREAPAPGLPALTKAPFLSLRNVPLWVGLVMVGVVAGIVVLVH